MFTPCANNALGKNNGVAFGNADEFTISMGADTGHCFAQACI